jgi:hypothetical protein
LSLKVSEGRERSTLLERTRKWLEGEEREESEKGVTYAFKVPLGAWCSASPLHHERLLQAEDLMRFMNARASGRTSKLDTRSASQVLMGIPPPDYSLACFSEGYAA